MPAAHKQIPANWRALALINYYRIFVAALALITYFILTDPSRLASAHPGFFVATVLLYLLVGAFSQFRIKLQTPDFKLQLYSQVFADIVLISMLMLSSDGISSGFGTLLIVPIAAIGLLIGGQPALVIAGIAGVLTLSQQTYHAAFRDTPNSDFMSALILVAALFAIAILTQTLGRRARENEALAEQRRTDLANLSQLNEHIIQRMESGVIVIDELNQIRLMNEAAWYLLGMPAKTQGQMLNTISTELAAQLSQWMASDYFEPKVFHVTGSVDLFPRFSRLGSGPTTGALIFLDDSSHMKKQAQHVKLSALGRLTASIAHEIRNPLGAVSHASQLLQESPNLDKADQRLTRIIREQTVRMNTIIENVMQLSRRDRAEPIKLPLHLWLQEFISEFRQAHTTGEYEITIGVEPRDVTVLMDASHLHQVVTNLCENALRHGQSQNGKVKIELRGGMTRESRGPFLDIIDSGPGVPPEMVQQIFEPFYTTDSKGTGLGLYIAQELCEVNHAKLEYVPIPTGGSCFRITFQQTQRRENATKDILNTVQVA